MNKQTPKKKFKYGVIFLRWNKRCLPEVLRSPLDCCRVGKFVRRKGPVEPSGSFQCLRCVVGGGGVVFSVVVVAFFSGTLWESLLRPDYNRPD